MEGLTDFQRKCESNLLSVLKKKHLNFSNRRLDGRKETYIYGQVKGLEIWIYEDGAEICGESVDKRFEKYGFKSEDELISRFKAELEKLI